jgi:hypothetical protein
MAGGHKMNVDYMKTLACSICKLSGSCETQKKIAELRGWKYIGGCTKYEDESIEAQELIRKIKDALGK